jgi:hypothetical protein
MMAATSSASGARIRPAGVLKRSQVVVCVDGDDLNRRPQVGGEFAAVGFLPGDVDAAAFLVTDRRT